MIPRARTEGLTTRDLRDETLVYDLEQHRVHRLNRTASLVWKQCDGKNTVADIATGLEQELATSASEELVHQALDQLQQARLLDGPQRLSRREFTGRARRTGALLLVAPLVTSLVAPTAAQASSSGVDPPSGNEGGESERWWKWAWFPKPGESGKGQQGQQGRRTRRSRRK